MKQRFFKEVDAYIAQFPDNTQKKLQQLRECILKSAPMAQEIISYKMPAYKMNGVLVYFAGYQNHIGFYPTGSGIKAFEKEIQVFKNSKGAVQFEIDKKLPLDLVKKMVLFRVQQDQFKTNSLKSLRTCKNGHQYYKSASCPVCPECEKQNKKKENVFSNLSAPALRALKNAGIKNLNDLSKFSQNDILELHGMGPASIPKLKKALELSGLKFKS